ncbi:citrate/2-methylcitrate synthase [Alicyclobacillus dauci]|uniref:Citrate synthase n=1 Tax=Alicyclobacillus dauci TaxID=1475485 RepID=A0ABY6Z6K1_9BACL|nr:citrate/2-methylcitrate synthase [Alicyclobacillus dauci]WAH38528.1 citrate synthase/methylcitrate synthase [Alicyclobacillus dauci]
MAWVNGLQDVVAAHTEISEVDGEAGRISYRGMLMNQLVGKASYEEVAHLLWTGHLPSREERDDLVRSFQAGHQIAENVVDVMNHLPAKMDLMDAATIGLLSLDVPENLNKVSQAAFYTSAFPVLLLMHYAKQKGVPFIGPRNDLGHVANYLWMQTGGEEPHERSVKVLEAYMILTMEHSLNASAFAGRVAASTRATMQRALAAAMMAMTGELHGGAPSQVIDMFNEIETEENAESWLRDRLAQGQRIMGFGHRIYRTLDPRARVLRDIAVEALKGQEALKLAQVVEDKATELLATHKPGRRLFTNVEYWAACVLRALQIPPELYTPTFSASRIVGWSAHILEQQDVDKLIRPKALYVGTNHELE